MAISCISVFIIIVLLSFSLSLSLCLSLSQDGKSPVRILRFHDEYPLIASATDDGLVTVVNFLKPTVSSFAAQE